MSATGRGTNRDPRDFYPTPRASFAPLLPQLPHRVKFWDPCAGDGRLIKWLREDGNEAGGADLFPQQQDVYPMDVIDYLRDPTRREFVLTNPPFSIAFEMVQHALIHAEESMFLLRLAFLESDTRGDWLSKHEPDGIWVLKKRPSFVMSVTCKSVMSEEERFKRKIALPMECRHNWLLPIESERPTFCPKCTGTKLQISTSDNSGYAWFYWGFRTTLHGIHHI